MGRCQCGKLLMPYAIEIKGVPGLAWLCPSKLPQRMQTNGGVEISPGVMMKPLNWTETREPDAPVTSELTVIRFEKQ